MPGQHLLIHSQPWALQAQFLEALTQWVNREIRPGAPLKVGLAPFAAAVGSSRATIARLASPKGDAPTPLPVFVERLASALKVSPETFLPLDPAEATTPSLLSAIEAPIGAREGTHHPLPSKGQVFPLLREAGQCIQVVEVVETDPPQVVYQRVGEGDQPKFQSTAQKFWAAVRPVPVSLDQATTTPGGFPNRRIVPGTAELNLEDTAVAPLPKSRLEMLQLTLLGPVGGVLATTLKQRYSIWRDPVDVVVPVLVTPTEDGRFSLSVPGQGESTLSLRVNAKILHRSRRGSSPEDIFQWMHGMMTRLSAQALDAALKAEAGVAQLQDPLLPLREVTQDLSRINDDLKILMVDTQDVAEESDDIRTSLIAKRTSTLRKSVQDVLKRLGSRG